MLRGTTTPAFSISSDMWAVESEPEESAYIERRERTDDIEEREERGSREDSGDREYNGDGAHTKYNKHVGDLPNEDGKSQRMPICSIVGEFSKNGAGRLLWRKDK